MSNRDSLGFGDLIPQDVVDIFAQDKHGKRGRKKRSHSLGRALGWLKGKKRKNLGDKGQSLGLGPALDLALDGHPAGHQGGHKGGQKSGRQTHPQGNSHAVPKQDNDDETPAPPLFQENVFIEASRDKYLENLHTEALEGLKMMQQEETNNGVEYKDNESMISRLTTHTDGEGGGFITDSTIADTTSVISVQSSVSTRSSRSGLTRQESTFRPLNSGKKSEKSKTRRRHRKTVVGIPHHVQRELGLDRVGWTVTPKLDEEQLYNGETSPTTDGPQQAESLKRANANLQDIRVIQPLSKDQLDQLNATHAGHRDDLALLHCLGPDLSGEQRPRSLAVPWMTTANSLQQEPPSPVMSMSPQAPYMSKIIPNAVLPPSIDVVEISRGRSRNSVRTVSKSSLVLSSPAPSRASSRASTRTTSSKASTITSASRHNPLSVSDSSCWSNSESSETLVSDSSTISSSSTPRQKRSQDGDSSDKNKCTSNGKVVIKVDEVKKEGPFVRSLSVMKPKRAPPPPSRSYSLHNKMKRRSRDLAEVKVISGESSLHNISASGEENENHKSSPMRSRVIDSPGYNADTSSLEDSMGSASFSPFKAQLQAQKAEEGAKIKENDASPEKQEPMQENKLSKIASPSSGYSSQEGTSAQLSKQAHSSSPRHKKGILAKLQRFFPGSTPSPSASPILTRPEAPVPSVVTASISPSVRTLRELFNIPPPPNVHAPPPPPPEVWVHSERSIELLLGPPVPDNIQAIIKKNPKDRRQQRQSPSASTEGSVKSLVVERKHNPTIPVESINGSVQVMETKKVQESGILNAEIHKESSDRLDGTSKVTERNEKVRVSDILNGMLVKAVEKREERLTTVREETKKTTTQTTEGKTNMDTLTAISIVRIPPSPSPPPLHLPSKPPTKQTTEVASVAAAQVVLSPEMSWPPPPSPMGLGGTDDIDFPLPPPPMFGEEVLVIPVCMPQERTIPDGSDSCTTTPVLSVVKTGHVRVTSGAEPQKPSTSQGITPPLNIPPPPPYTAPPPPIQTISTHTTIKVCPPPPKEFSPPPPPPPPKEVSPPPPEMVSPPPPKVFFPPPPKKVFLPPPEVPSPPPKEVSPPSAKQVSPVRPKECSPPAIQEATPPPVKEVSPPLVTVVSPPPVKEVSPPLVTVVSPPPVKEVSPPLVTVVSPPPVKEVSSPLVTEVSSPPVKEVSPPLVTEVSSPPVKEVSPPLVTEVSPPPVKEVSPPLVTEVSPPPVKEVSPPLVTEVSPPPVKEVSPPLVTKVSPPPVKEVSPPLVTKVSPPPVKEVSPPLVTKVSPPPVKEVSPPLVTKVSPPPVKEVSPPLVTKVSPPPVKEVSPPLVTKVSPPPVKEVSPPLVTEISSPPVKKVSPPLVTVVSPPQVEVEQVSPQVVTKVSPLPPEEPLSTKDVSPSSSQENGHHSIEEATPISMLTPPQSIPPPPPLPTQSQSSEQEINPPQENAPSESETNSVSSNSILSPPQSIPPLPPIQLLHQPEVVPPNTDDPATQEGVPSPPSEDSIQKGLENSPTEKAQEPAPSQPVIIPVPPPLPVQGLASIKHQPSPASIENQTLELTSAPVVQEEPTPIVTPSILQMVKLRSVNSSPEPPKAQDEPEAEVTMRNQLPRNEVPTSSSSGEPPQKPIRRSLIMTSPVPTSPPAVVTSQPALPKSQSLVIPPVSSSTVLSPTKKSPTTTISPSMNLQEAIRLRTAARSQGSATARLSLHSPTSPVDFRKSPSSTASFVFSKSNKKMVIETNPAPGTKTTIQKNLEVSSATKVVSQTEFVKKEVKVPPPVAKKPKKKGTEIETSEGTEQTAGQEALKENIMDAEEKTNGTAGTVEGGGTPST
ncbi:uncharacterized protein KIAA1522 homolog isoform X4 [Larimichthys crocea]|uniref:uncharacterized protein KIAA1522 homolog isoform X4 n=1 Tax=Larimichthys crocea TaxID=215358 RepID=UPI000F5ED0DE|nr:uncharacterized protein KIAA1522 homolog isoform X4 [Larimichthys crocea]